MSENSDETKNEDILPIDQEFIDDPFDPFDAYEPGDPKLLYYTMGEGNA
jgi:hypothetical protein